MREKAQHPSGFEPTTSWSRGVPSTLVLQKIPLSFQDPDRWTSVVEDIIYPTAKQVPHFDNVDWNPLTLSYWSFIQKAIWVERSWSTVTMLAKGGLEAEIRKSRRMFYAVLLSLRSVWRCWTLVVLYPCAAPFNCLTKKDSKHTKCTLDRFSSFAYWTMVISWWLRHESAIIFGCHLKFWLKNPDSE